MKKMKSLVIKRKYKQFPKRENKLRGEAIYDRDKYCRTLL